MKILIFLCFLLPTISFSQTNPYDKVIALGSASTDEIYKSARRVIAKLLIDANEEIVLDDPETKELFGKGIIHIPQQAFVINEFYLLFDVRFQAKDGRYKLALEDIYMEYLDNPKPYTDYCKGYSCTKNKPCARFKQELDGFFNEIITGTAAGLTDSEWQILAVFIHPIINLVNSYFQCSASGPDMKCGNFLFISPNRNRPYPFSGIYMVAAFYPGNYISMGFKEFYPAFGL